jgi:hypothetical protein
MGVLRDPFCVEIVKWCCSHHRGHDKVQGRRKRSMEDKAEGIGEAGQQVDKAVTCLNNHAKWYYRQQAETGRMKQRSKNVQEMVPVDRRTRDQRVHHV